MRLSSSRTPRTSATPSKTRSCSHSSGSTSERALSRARAIEETRQRNAELALINSVQDALAGELEMQALYEVVGDKLQEIFDAQVVDICTYDRRRTSVHFPYSIERGERTSWEPYPLSSLGFMQAVIETGEPLLRRGERRKRRASRLPAFRL